MRHKSGIRFDHCIGLQDKSEDGKVFDANTLDCHDKPLNAGEDILVGNRPYRYRGDDSLGNSIFIPLAPFPECEIVEREYDGLFIALEIYTMKNGRFYVWPYVQTGSTESGCYTRQGFSSEVILRHAKRRLRRPWQRASNGLIPCTQGWAFFLGECRF